MASLLIKNIGLLASSPNSDIKKGVLQKEISFVENCYIYSIDGIIKEIGKDNYPQADEVIDVKGKLVTPGLVDAHTHLVFGGWRQHEMKMKLDGVSYLEILKNGGGILSTVKATNNASKKELVEKAKRALDEMMHLGTTTLEAKSGYGLEFEQEIKQLEAVKQLNDEHPIDIISTFMGAHAFLEEFKNNREEFVEKICQMIPYVAENKLAEFCDVFCEKGVFNVEEARKILLKAQEYNLKSKIHADEIESIGGSKLAQEIGAISAEHLIVCDDEGIEALSKSDTIACLLPATSFYLGSDFAPARKMIDNNIPIALASDFNPGSCPCLNMQLVMNLGCLKYKMSPEEVLNAVTINAAAAINRNKLVGSIEIGKKADILIWDADDLNYICYRFGSNLINKVIKNGKVIVDHEKAS